MTISTIAFARDARGALAKYEIRGAVDFYQAIEAVKADLGVKRALCLVIAQPEQLKGDTVIQPHQQRVMDEKNDLDEKLAKLGAFFATPIFSTLSAGEQDRLRRQAESMKVYSGVLGERIGAFGF